MQRRILGRTGIEVSELSIGTGTHGYNNSSEQVRLGRDRLARLLRFAYDSGLTFWDLADSYGSHEAAALAMKDIRRESLVITTKTGSRTPQSVREDVHRYCRELGTDYLDVLLLHCLCEHDWAERYAGAMEEMDRLKAEGLVRAVGCSCHDFRALELTAQTGWVDVNLVRINYAGLQMDAGPEQVIPIIRQMHASGKGLYGMKVLGQGPLGHDPARAIDYVLGLGCLDAITIGMTSDDQVRQNVQILESRADRMAKAA